MKLQLKINNEITYKAQALHYEVYAKKEIVEDLVKDNINNEAFKMFQNDYIESYTEYEKFKKQVIQKEVLNYLKEELKEDINESLVSWNLDFENSIIDITYDAPQNVCNCGCC